MIQFESRLQIMATVEAATPEPQSKVEEEEEHHEEGN